MVAPSVMKFGAAVSAYAIFSASVTGRGSVGVCAPAGRAKKRQNTVNFISILQELLYSTASNSTLSIYGSTLRLLQRQPSRLPYLLRAHVSNRTLLISIETISISRIGRRSGPRV